MTVKLPLGKDIFPKLRGEGCYYIDKTEIIKKILNTSFDVFLITRPRRFGKSLTMSMLEDFFDISRDSRTNFEGLNISTEKELCEEWQNQWPVISLTLKAIEGLTFEEAYRNLKIIISELCKKYAFLEESECTNKNDRLLFGELVAQKADPQNTNRCIALLMRMMHAHYGKPAIVLIDEYDVPLAKADENGFYREMLSVIRAMFEPLKSNTNMKFAIVTGCLKIAKESIFTGTNNFIEDGILGDYLEEYIGFTELEVGKLLEDSGFTDHAQEIKDWYDGYLFGSAHVYCPWDVLNHVSALQKNPKRYPKNYWGKTSHNSIVYQCIDRENLNLNSKFETLMAGGSLTEEITDDLTYDTIESSEANLWSVLFMTGYLTQDEWLEDEDRKDDQAILRIPNEEIRLLFKETIIKWFHDKVTTVNRDVMFEALWDGNVRKAEQFLSDLLFNTISYYDYKEDYYHAFLVGAFAGAGYIVESNKECGTGRPDVVVKDNAKRRAMVLEVKHTRQKNELDSKLAEAVKQITEKRYTYGLSNGYRSVISYGVAFFEKECKIQKA